MKCIRWAALLAVTTACPGGDDTQASDATTGVSSSGGTFMASASEGAEETGDVEGSQCDPFAQDCPMGFKCKPPLPIPPGNLPECVPIPEDPIALDQDCAFGPGSTDECDVGLICVPRDGEAMLGVCLAVCQGSADAPVCPEQTVCDVTLDPFVACLPLCHPFDDPCREGWNCIQPASDGGEFFCAGVLPGAGGPGDSCMTPSNCQAGNTCMEAAFVPGCGDARCCTEFCDLDDPSFACALADGGQTCTALGNDPSPGFENVGVCAAPG